MTLWLAPAEPALDLQAPNHGHNAHSGGRPGGGLNVGGRGSRAGSSWGLLLFPVGGEDALGGAVVDVEFKAGLFDGHVVMDDKTKELSSHGFVDFGVLFGVSGGKAGNGMQREGFHQV